MKIYAEGNCFIVDREDGYRPQAYGKRIGKIIFSQMNGPETVEVANQGDSTIAMSKITELKNDDAEVDSTGTVTLAGAAGSVDGITVDGVEIMSGAVDFLTSLTITAAAVVVNINAGPQKLNYLASSSGAIITITALANNKTDANGLVVVASTTTITTTDVNMASGVTALVGDTGDPDADYLAVRQYLTVFIG